jgi:hypothetical protein
LIGPLSPHPKAAIFTCLGFRWDFSSFYRTSTHS